MGVSMNEGDTSVRVRQETKEALTKARAQMILDGKRVRSDNDTIRELLEHWERTGGAGERAGEPPAAPKPCDG